jgi:hypothetical protein
MDPKDTRPVCVGWKEGRVRKCYALPGSIWCVNHDPSLAAKRSAQGRIRHVRFAHVLEDLPPVDRARVPTIARIIDELLDIAQEARNDVNAAGQATNPAGLNVAVSALRAAMAGLELERSRMARRPPMLGEDGLERETLEEQLSQ